MRVYPRFVAGVAFLATLFSPAALAQGENQTVVQHTGASSLWILANISYAGMRAQNHPSVGWRIVAFIAGFPGTLASFLVVEEGSCRAYGVELPPRRG